MDKRLRKGLENYKKIVDTLVELETIWDEHREFMSSRPSLEHFPREAQRFMKYGYNRSKMVLGLPRLLENAAVVGGLGSMKFDLPEEEKKGKKDAA